MKKSEGGNAHQRAVARSAGTTPSMTQTKQYGGPIDGKRNLPRVVELVSFALAVAGGLGLISSYFWIGVAICEGGMVILLLTILLYDRGWVRYLFAPIAMAALIFVNWDVVFRKVPIDFLANVPVGDYEHGTMLGDVTWRPEFTYLTVTLENESDFDFTDVDFIIEPDVPIVAISQMSAVPGVVLHGDATKEVITIGDPRLQEPSANMRRPTFTRTERDGHKTEFAVRQLLTPQYRVTCEKVVKHSSLDVIMAVARLDQERSSKTIEYSVNETASPDHPDLTVAIGATDPAFPVVYTKTKPTHVRIVGSYMAHLKPREFKAFLNVQ